MSKTNQQGPRRPSVRWAVLLPLAAVAMVAVVFWRFGPGHVNGVAPLADQLSYPGFQTFPTPRTLDSPGTVFRIDRSGRRFPVTRLAVTIERGDEAFAAYTTTARWRLSALAKYLGQRKLEVATAGVSGFEVKAVLGRGVRETTFDVDVDQLLTLTNITFRDDNKYYVIRETIAVPAITFDFSGSAGFNSDAKESVNRLVQGDQSLTWGNDMKSSLVERFDTPHRVFFNADELFAPGLGAGEPKPQRAPAHDKVSWVEEVYPSTNR